MKILSKEFWSILFVALVAFSELASAVTVSTSTVIGGNLAGQPLSGSAWSISVLPGSEISGNVQVSNFNAHRAGAVVPFGYTWTWGARESSIVTVDNWISTGSSNYNVPINLTAPEDTGIYYILFGHRGEFNLGQVFSATNWEKRSLTWNDGNDYHDMDDATLQFAHDNGYVEAWSYLFPSGYHDVNLAVLPIKINVSNVPVPSAVWLFISGVLFLKSLDKRNKCFDVCSS